jgi:hypothetical protein
MSDITPIITALASTTICGGITGISKAYDVAPSNVDLPLPCCIFSPFEGEIGGFDLNPLEFQGLRETVHRIKAQVLVSLQSDLQDSERQARPFLNRFVTTIDHWKTLNGTANVYNAMVRRYKYGLITLRQGDPNYLGWEFTIEVFENETNVVYNTTGPTI